MAGGAAIAIKEGMAKAACFALYSHMLAIYEATSTCDIVGGQPNQKVFPVNLGKNLRISVRGEVLQNLARTTNIEGCPGLL